MNAIMPSKKAPMIKIRLKQRWLRCRQERKDVLNLYNAPINVIGWKLSTRQKDHELILVLQKYIIAYLFCLLIIWQPKNDNIFNKIWFLIAFELKKNKLNFFKLTFKLKSMKKIITMLKFNHWWALNRGV